MRGGKTGAAADAVKESIANRPGWVQGARGCRRSNGLAADASLVGTKSMVEIGLISMPFAAVQLPSIGLTQLKHVLRSHFSGQICVRIYYLNHDFYGYMGKDNYSLIANTPKATACGLGDWFFRRVAFPYVEDNEDAYCARYMWNFENETCFFQCLCEKRDGLEEFLDDLIDCYKLDRLWLAGFTTMFAQNVASLAMARKLKERNPAIVTALGGANCETSMGEVMAGNADGIDFVFSGPALKTFPQVVGCLLEGEEDKCHEITGVLSRRKLAGARGRPLNEVGEELDIEADVGLDYDDFLASVETKCPSEKDNLALLFETSRGCWWGERSQCTFCGLNGSGLTYRAMSPQRARRQFEELFKYAPAVSQFKSVDNIMPREYLESLLPNLRVPKGTRIFYEIKTNLTDDEVRLLAQAGVTEIQPGVEALATSTLRLMRKGTTAFQNVRFLKSCLVHGIHPNWNLLIGFPGEEEAVYQKYFDELPSLTHLPPPTGIYPVRFDRFSPYFVKAEEYRLELKPYDFYEMVYPFDARDLNDLAYFFFDQNADAPHVRVAAKWIKRLQGRVAHWRSCWERRDGRPEPRLVVEWRGDSRVVCDTRSGAVVEREIDELGLRLLDLLQIPMKRSHLAAHFGDVPESELGDAIEALRASRLVFEEGERIMSLVVESGRVSGYL